MRTFLLIGLGMIIMLIVLKVLSKTEVVSTSETWNKAKVIIRSGQFYNLTRTNEFRELLKMPETKALLNTLATNQIAEISNQLL